MPKEVRISYTYSGGPDYIRWECESCYNRYQTRLRAVGCETEHRREKDLDRNLKIILDCMPYLYPLNLRGCAAIYRIYRQLDFSPRQIVEFLIERGICYTVYGQKKDSLIEKVKNIIGEVFRFLCENSDSCILKPYLHMENKTVG